MIKKVLFSLMLFTLMSFQVANAQCSPDLSITTPGIYPDSATGLPCAIVDSVYSVTITAVVPVDTVVIVGVPIDFWIDSIVLLDITGLPPGLGRGCVPLSCGFSGGTSGCVVITGAPIPGSAGLYPIEVFTRAYVTDKAGAFPQQQQNDTITYYFINVVDALILDTISVTNTSSCGASDGAIDLSVTGGTNNYAYIWDDPATSTTQDIGSLAPGIYTVTVTDGCFSRTLSVTVADPGTVSVNTVSVTAVSVFGGDDGAIDIMVTGGNPPYAFSWTGPGGFTATTEDLDTLSAGTYVVTVTDINNCSSSLSVDIGQPSGISEIDARSFSIVQNNPNPFTDKTEIIFTTVKTGVVKFKVYNVLGKLVYSENINAKAGANRIEFTSKGLPQGLYMYSLRNDKHGVTKRMIIAAN